MEDTTYTQSVKDQKGGRFLLGIIQGIRWKWTSLRESLFHAPTKKKNNIKFLPSVSIFLIKGKQRQKTEDFITRIMSYIVVQLLSHVHHVQPFATP